MLQKQEPKVDYQYREYGYRIAVSLIFSLLSFVNGMCWVTVSPISVPIARVYEQPDSVVSIIPLSYTVIYLFINFPSNWVLDVKGIKKGIVVGAVLTAVGAGFRCLVQTHFGFIITGQILCAIAQPFILNAPAKLVIRWFLPKNRTLAVAGLTIANIVGTAVGFILPPLFVEQNASDDKIRNQFTALLWFQFFATLVPATTALLWFKQKPPTPASLGSMVDSTQFFKGIRQLFSNKKFLTLNYAFGTIYGSFCIYGSLMDNLFDCYGYSTKQVSYLFAIMMISGIVAACFLGVYIERSLRYHCTFIVLAVLGIIQCVGTPLLLGLLGYNFDFAALLMVVQGIVFISLMPLSFDYGCQILFPAGQAQITGCLMTSGNLMGLIFILISQVVIGLGETGNSDGQNRRASLITVVVLGASTVSGVFLYFFFNSKLLRSRYQSNSQQRSSLIMSI